MKQKEGTEAALEHELELARLGQEHNPAVQVPRREDRAKPLNYLHLLMARMTLRLTFSVLGGLQLMR